MLSDRKMNAIAWDAVTTVPSEYNRITLLWIQYGNSHTDRLSVESKLPGANNDRMKEVCPEKQHNGTILKYKASTNRAQKLREST
jgi:hypothetical protein